MLTRRLGNLGFPFDDNKQTIGALGRELRIVRNARAHGDPFTRLDAWRAHDYCVRLLEYFGDAEGLLKANELRQEALVAYVEEQGIAPEVRPNGLPLHFCLRPRAPACGDIPYGSCERLRSADAVRNSARRFLNRDRNLGLGHHVGRPCRSR